MNKKYFGQVKSFSGSLKKLSFKGTLKAHEMAHCKFGNLGITNAIQSDNESQIAYIYPGNLFIQIRLPNLPDLQSQYMIL